VTLYVILGNFEAKTTNGPTYDSAVNGVHLRDDSRTQGIKFGVTTLEMSRRVRSGTALRTFSGARTEVHLIRASDCAASGIIEDLGDIQKRCIQSSLAVIATALRR
jgi:hypothetical protein